MKTTLDYLPSIKQQELQALVFYGKFTNYQLENYVCINSLPPMVTVCVGHVNL